ncbi:MAG: 30S ribosome-binding factor RbfA [Clostridiaceae bacterium]|nr:30S ribosome-binding factor RbfA [Clostridiaceae bacterium]
MPSNPNRIDRIGEEILRELSALLRQVKDPRIQGPMISVLRCEVTNDLRWCKVFLTVLGEYDEKELKKGLKSCSGFLRRELAHRLALRYTPELVFVLDDSIAHSAHIAEVLNKLDIKHEKEENVDNDGAV